jgi:sucrose-6-phosphate hydrolase SacC (GH32 family)
MTPPPTGTTVRPRIHFAPAANWMNDPNGLIHHGGLFHLYFQHNPESADWGNMSWGHATSADLISWQEHAVALRFDDDEQVFSGSIVYDSTNSSGLGTAESPPLVAVYTSATPRGQSQALASSLDGGYIWQKHGVVLDRGTADFRDPKVFRHDGAWVLISVEAVDRQVHLFRSDDLHHWTPLSVFGPFGAPGGLWECPDLFPVGDRWVLTLSINPGHPAGGSGMQYIVGDFDGVTFTAERWDWLDHGHDCYAGVIFNGVDHPVMLAWLNNWAYAHDVPTSPWRGSAALPRRLALRGSTLVQVPAVSVELPVSFELRDVPLGEGRFELPPEAHGSAIRIQTRIRVDGATVELWVRGAEDTDTAVRISYADGLLTVDRAGTTGAGFVDSFGLRTTAPLVLQDGILDLDVWVDTTSVEVFAGDGTVTISELVLTADERSGVGLTTDRPGAIVEHLVVTDLSTLASLGEATDRPIPTGSPRG